MKTCFKCGDVKPLTDFYTHKQMADGHLNKCIPCTKKDTALRERKLRETNADWVMKERERARLKIKLYRAIHGNGEYKNTWSERYPHKRKTHHAVNNALRDGRLTRPNKCESCGKSEKLQAHHDDYGKPLAVRWLCIPCHGKAHRKPAPQLIP